MERQDYINQINSLQATIKNLLGMIETLRQTLESVNASSKRNEDLVKKLSAQIEEYQKQMAFAVFCGIKSYIRNNKG